MLRGVTGRSVSVTEALIFDILKSDLLRVVKDASGGMLPADGVLARDQVSAGIGSRFSARESSDSDSDGHHHTHHSQPRTLHARHEQVRQRLSPRSSDRGPIEAVVEP